LLKKELLEPLPRPKKERVPSSSEGPVSRWRSFSRWLRRRRSLLWPSLSSSSPPKMEAAMPLKPAPIPIPAPEPALEREERWRERERERLRSRSLWEWRLLRCDLERFECEVWAEMTEPASSKMPMAAVV
jgi:hypothetical protein